MPVATASILSAFIHFPILSKTTLVLQSVLERG
jgi:hypothetical protein